MALLEKLRSEGKRVVGYGATSKSTTITNYCGITPAHVEFISDTTPIKQGKLSPGAHIPVKPTANLPNLTRTMRLLFAWNHAAEIREKELLSRRRRALDRLCARSENCCRDRPVIPLASPLAQYRAHEEEVRAAITRVLDSGNYILGEEVQSFERAFASLLRCGAGSRRRQRHRRANPGPQSTRCRLRATRSSQCRTRRWRPPPRFSLAERRRSWSISIRLYYTIDPAAVEAAITPRSKAIIAVHLYGQAAAIDDIRAIAQRRGLFVVEDCAQAAGAHVSRASRWQPSAISAVSASTRPKISARSATAAWSSRPTTALATRVRRLRQYGWDDARVTHEVGVNSRLGPAPGGDFDRQTAASRFR